MSPDLDAFLRTAVACCLSVAAAGIAVVLAAFPAFLCDQTVSVTLFATGLTLGFGGAFAAMGICHFAIYRLTQANKRARA